MSAKTVPGFEGEFWCPSASAAVPLGVARKPIRRRCSAVVLLAVIFGFGAMLALSAPVSAAIVSNARIVVVQTGVGRAFVGAGVLLGDGSSKPISEMEVGDVVLAEDPQTGERGLRTVTHLWAHQDSLVDLEIDDVVVATTEDHPFWNHTDAEWQRADSLDPGDLVLAADGDLLPVNGVDWETVRTETAHNLTVDGIHTYYVQVGDDHVLVHNTNPLECQLTLFDPDNPNAPNSTRFFAGNGPLDEGVAATFRSGTYDEVLLSQDTLLYRVYGGEAGPIGGYWSRTPPTGPMQAQMDLALNPEWGNLATDVATIRVPAGATIYEGAAAAQSLPAGGTLLGGGNQVFIPNVNPGWLVGG